tara:strand:- start:24 stop:422 length:399 start_codon:yes stop_codon:yes gene_type:complete
MMDESSDTPDYDFKANLNDFVIQLEPILTEDGEWTSEVNVNIVYSENNDLDEDDFSTLFTLANLICSSFPFYADHPEIMSLAVSHLDRIQETLDRKDRIEGLVHSKFYTNDDDEDSESNTVIKVNFKKDRKI